MLNKLQKRNSKGFTIIEVMIVLAIAALILLIVLLAIPALQRGSRNTQRKNDVSAITAAATEFTNNNSGVAPTTATGNNPVVFGGGAGLAKSNASVGFYNSGSAQQAACQNAGVSGHVYLITGGAACATLPGNNTHDYVEVVTGASCNGSGTVATPRATAVLYEIESAGGYTAQCQGS